MAPLLQDEPRNQQASSYDRCSTCDSTPSSSHHRRALVGVHFSNDLVQIHQIANREDYTPKETSACWYSREEKLQMQESCENILVRMEAGMRPKKNTSYRGLENFHTCNTEEFQRTIGACIDAVMDEQDRQWKEGNCIHWDPFREASLEASKHSASLAYRMAVYDEREARKAYIAMARECQQLKDDASVSTEMTDTSKSTLVHDIKSKHNKANSANPATRPSSGPTRKAETQKSKSGPPRCRSSGSRKASEDVFNLLKQKTRNAKDVDRSLRSMISRAA